MYGSLTQYDLDRVASDMRRDLDYLQFDLGCQIELLTSEVRRLDERTRDQAVEIEELQHRLNETNKELGRLVKGESK